MRKELHIIVFFLFQDFLKYSKKANLDTTELEVLETFSLIDLDALYSKLLLVLTELLSFSDILENVIMTSVYFSHFCIKATIGN